MYMFLRLFVFIQLLLSCNGDQLFNFSVPELLQSQLALTRKSFRIAQVSHCVVQPVQQWAECSAVIGLAPCMLCVQIYCVLCVLDYYLLNSQL